MSKNKESTLLKILSLSSPSSFEDSVREFFLEHFKDRAVVGKDVLGNVAANIRGDRSGSKVMLTAHMDEVGFIVVGVDSGGFVGIKTIGGPDVIEPSEVDFSKVKILNAAGEVQGIVCNGVVVEQGSEESSIKDTIFVDIGATSKAEALKRVSVGDAVVWDTSPIKLSKTVFSSRGVDDKIGVYIITRVLDEILKKYKTKPPPSSVFGVLSPMEEVGDFNCVREAADKIAPGVGIVVEVIESTDYPGSTGYWCDFCGQGQMSLGKGPVIDVGITANKKLVDYTTSTAKSMGIDIQKYVSVEDTSTTMDRLRYGANGIPCVGIYVPIRYMHSPMSVFDFEDVEKAVKLIVRLCEKVDSVETFLP